MSRLLSQALLIGTTLAMTALFVLSRGSPYQEALLSGAGVVLILLSVLLERLAPFRPAWNESRGDLPGDMGAAIVILGVLEPLLKWLTPLALLWLLPAFDGLDAVSHAPLFVQVFGVLLLTELGAYLSHRAHHAFAPLWALHAMHHAPERLYTLNNFRFHPLNYILNHLLMLVPVLMLGFDPEAVVAVLAITLPALLLQHSNIAFDFGWLDGFVNTNSLHRWHHSTREAEGNRNFGRALVIWDRLLGTYHNPKAGSAPEAVGLFAASRNYPDAGRFFAQLGYPFSRACCARG